MNNINEDSAVLKLSKPTWILTKSLKCANEDIRADRLGVVCMPGHRILTGMDISDVWVDATKEWKVL